MTVRRDWDYVAIDDYRSDLAEAYATAQGVCNALKQENDNLRQMLWMAIHAAGGRIVVDWHSIAWFEKDKSVLEIADAPQVGGRILRAYRKDS